MPALNKVIPNGKQAARAIDQTAPVHFAGRRVRLGREEEEDEDAAHVAYGEDVDGDAELAECELRGGEGLAAQAFDQDAGHAGDVGGDEAGAGDGEDDVEGERGLWASSVCWAMIFAGLIELPR